MDERDVKILNTLVKNARTSYVELAKILGITEAAVRKRVKRLEEKRIIQRYTIVVEPALLGFTTVAIVGIDTKPEALLKTHDALKRISGVQYSALSSGDHNIIFEIWCKNSKELRKAMENIKLMPGVKRVCPAVLVKKRETSEENKLEKQ